MISALSSILNRIFLDRTRFILVLFLSVITGLYVTFVQTVDNKNLTIVLIVIPITAGVIFVKDAPQLLMIGFIFALTFSARFRFGSAMFHSGGAEFSLAPIDFPLLGLLFLWIKEAISEKRPLRIRLTLLGAAYWLFFFSQIPSLANAADKALVWAEILRLAKMGLLVLIVKHYIRTEKDLRNALVILFSAAIFQGILAFSQTQFATSFGLGFLGERDVFFSLAREGISFGRAGGTLGHSNALANFFEITLPISLSIYISNLNFKFRLFAFLTFCSGSIGLFFTNSRAGWAAVLIGLFVSFILMFWYHQKQRIQLMKYGISILILISTLGLVFYERILQRIKLFSDDSWTFRLGTYDIAFNMFHAHPIIGIGANNYMILAETYINPLLALIFANSPVHNIFILILAETGILGLLAFVFLIFCIVRQAQKLMHNEQELISVTAIGLFSGIFALLAHAMLDWLLRYDPIYTLFWFAIGLLAAIEQMGMINQKPLTTLEVYEK